MEVSGTILRQANYVSGAGTRRVVPRGVSGGVVVRVRMVMDSSFRDESHLQYYQDNKKGQPLVLTTKKKLKLLKNLSKTSSLFAESGFAFDLDQRALFDCLQGNLTKDAEEVLLKKLEQIRAEEKELKRKKKQEKKAKLKASKIKTCESESSSSSSESESSDSNCDNKVVDMNRLRTGVSVGAAPESVNELQASMLSPPTLLPQITVAAEDSTPWCSTKDASVGSVSVGFKNESNNTYVPQKRIEVCMGNKCKKSGAAALLQEFERVVGVEGGAVVGCKCMGKCKSGPNVRIQNSADNDLAQGLSDSVKVPVNPLCIGVGLEDVDTIVARFLGDESQDMVGMAPHEQMQ